MPASEDSQPTSAVTAVRVVCVVYHPGPELADFAMSLATASNGPIELVLVDNGDDSTTATAVVEQVNAAGHPHMHARLIVMGRNAGYGAAANAGAAGAEQPWLVVVNPDIVWGVGSLDELIGAASTDPTIGAAGPVLLNVDGTVYPSARALPSLVTGAGHAALSRVWPSNPWTAAYRRMNESSDVPRDAGWLSGACLLLRREAFEQVGGFDDAYFMFFEDLDLGERIGAAGWRNRYVTTAQVTHVGGTSWRSTPAPMIRAHHASARRYLDHRYTGWHLAPLRAAIHLGLRLRERSQLRATA